MRVIFYITFTFTFTFTFSSPVRENEELTKDILKTFIRLSSDNQAVDYLVDKKVVSMILPCITTTKNGK